MSRRIERPHRLDHDPRPDRSRERPPSTGRFGRDLRPGWAARVRRLRPPASWRVPVPMRPRSWERLGRRWLPESRAGRALGALLAVVTFMGATWGVSRSALLDVDDIEVIGGFQVAVEEATAASGLRLGDPLLGVDVGDARRGLEALPWVRRATVERALPNRVRLRLTERLATASAPRAAGGYALLDDTGRVLAARPQRPEGLPEVQGSGEPPEPGAWLRPARPALLVVAALPEQLRREVSTATVDGGSVTVRLGGREVRFGPAEELEVKASALAAVLDHLGSRAVAYVDVRVPSAPVVAPVGGPPAPAVAASSAARPRD